MSVVRGLVIVVACGLCFGGAGGLLGLALGVGAPSYYRGVFRAADDPGFNPVQVGLGLGVSQGLICGAVIGAVVVLAVALSRPSRQRGEPVDVSAPQIAPDRSQATRMRRVLILVAVLAASAIGGVIGFVVGALVGESHHYQQSTDAKLAKIRPVLGEQQFAGVDVEYSSAAQVYLMGTVDSEQAYKALEERMRFLFGDEEARFMLLPVEVAKK